MSQRRVVDHALRNARRARVSRDRDRFDRAAWLLDEAVDRLAERLASVRRRFGTLLELGASGGRVAAALAERTLEPHARIRTVDRRPAALPEEANACAAAPTALPFADGAFDLVVSAMTLHWEDDPDGALREALRVLRPDGLFAATFLGGETLAEARAALLRAEIELGGGAALRFLPTIPLADAAAGLQRAGFALAVADVDRIEARYVDPRKALAEVRSLGETVALAPELRSRKPLPRAAIDRAIEHSADASGGVEFRFELIFALGWKPHESQARPARRGSAARGFSSRR